MAQSTAQRVQQSQPNHLGTCIHYQLHPAAVDTNGYSETILRLLLLSAGSPAYAAGRYGLTGVRTQVSHAYICESQGRTAAKAGAVHPISTLGPAAPAGLLHLSCENCKTARSHSHGCARHTRMPHRSGRSATAAEQQCRILHTVAAPTRLTFASCSSSICTAHAYPAHTVSHEPPITRCCCQGCQTAHSRQQLQQQPAPPPRSRLRCCTAALPSPYWPD